MQEIIIRKAMVYDWKKLTDLAWNVFCEFEAPEYGEEGTKHFQDFLTDPLLERMFWKGEYPAYVAMDGEKCVGVVTLRNRNHISLLFVDKAYHRQGLGRKLLLKMAQSVKEEERLESITVNAAPYATEFYHRVGFRDLDEMQKTDGILYTPMEWKF